MGEDELIAMILLIPLAILATLVLLVVKVIGLRRRLDQAETRLGEIAAQLRLLQPVSPTSSVQLPEVAPTPVPPSDASRPPPLPVMPPEVPQPPAVARPDLVQIAVGWLMENWFYVIAGLSLALAGLFAAQYAAERGMLSPMARLILAAGLGVALIGAGEAIRRRWGDETDSATAYLPSIFSGAGLVTLYGTVLTAQMLYALIGPGVTLAGLVLVSALAVVLGWFYGPFLAVIGLAGATVAPFLAGGEPGAPWLIQSYFGLVMLTGLVINAARKWRFLDEVALALPFLAAALVHATTGGDAAFLCLSALMPIVATIFFGGALQPRLEMPPVVVRMARRDRASVGWRQWALLIVWGAGLAAILKTIMTEHYGDIAGADLRYLIAALAVGGQFALATFWSRRAPAVADFAVLTGAALLVLATQVSPMLFLPTPEAPVQSAMMGFGALIAAATLGSLLAARQSGLATGPAALWWAQGAAVLGPGVLAVEELLQAPARMIGPTLWAGIVMAGAAVATLLAERAGKRDGADHGRMSLAALAAMALLALALFILLGTAALSVALGVLVLAAVAMDDRWRLPHLAAFAQAGAAVLVYRVTVDPGLDWALSVASYPDILLAHALPAAALAAGWLLVRGSARPVTRAALEGAFAVVAGAGLSVLITRGLEDLSDQGTRPWHLTLGLIGSVWLLAGWSSARTALAETPEQAALPGHKAALWLRRITATLSFVSAAGLLATGVIFGTPFSWFGGTILGPVVVSSLALAYLLPGLIGCAIAATLRRMPLWLRVGFWASGAGLVALYLFLSVAQAWRGNDPARLPMSEGELWSYTALLLVIGAGLLVAALMRRETWLRYVADAVLGLAIVKVFFVDASDLGGLVRAGSFLILGLALAGLAWINRRAAMLTAEARKPD